MIFALIQFSDEHLYMEPTRKLLHTTQSSCPVFGLGLVFLTLGGR